MKHARVHARALKCAVREGTTCAALLGRCSARALPAQHTATGELGTYRRYCSTAPLPSAHCSHPPLAAQHDVATCSAALAAFVRRPCSSSRLRGFARRGASRSRPRPPRARPPGCSAPKHASRARRRRRSRRRRRRRGGEQPRGWSHKWRRRACVERADAAQQSARRVGQGRQLVRPRGYAVAISHAPLRHSGTCTQRAVALPALTLHAAPLQGGLALVAVLATTEGAAIITALQEEFTPAPPVSGEVVTLPSGVSYKDTKARRAALSV